LALVSYLNPLDNCQVGRRANCRMSKLFLNVVKGN
jgi:hypothetical protein